MKRTGPTNEHLQKLISDLREKSYKENARIWKRIADDLSKPTRQRRIINISKVARYTKENDQIIVPGKVLASGTVAHKLTVAAYQFSKSAVEKLKASNATMISIEEAMNKNPKGKDFIIMG